MGHCLARLSAAPLIVAISALVASACPFCSAVSQTFRQEMAGMDAVVIAEAPQGNQGGESAESEGKLELRISKVLKGEDLVRPGQTIEAVYFGSVEPGRRFMLTGVDPPQLMWSSPLPVSERSEAYLAKVLSMPDDALARLQFFQQYLEDEDPMLARDAYDEFAITPYEDVKKLRDSMDHAQLVGWIRDPEMPADRKRLYLTMLGICGSEKDLPMLEKMIRSTQKSARSGLDALIGCYLTLRGADGLPLVDELFLANRQSEYADTYAAIQALRFHGTEGGVIERDQIVHSLHHVLERPELADLVIPDLARWEDWSQIDRLVRLFKEAEDGNNWVRVPVINYLRACPLPEAKAAIEELEKIDPAAVRRANTFFPVPTPGSGPGGTDTSSVLPSARPAAAMRPAAPSAALLASTASAADVVKSAPDPTPAAANPWRILAVTGTTGTSLLIAMWLTLSGV